MRRTLEFPDLVTLIDERSAAFRTAVAAAPSLDVTVPSCPEWTLFDLARHLGEGRQSWAATVAAGPGATSKAPPGGPSAPRDREALTAWLASSTQLLLDALREAGPDRGCWTWWGDSQSPQNSAAVARHQLQEVAVHTYDAQLAAGQAQPLPVDVALDGVEDFLSTCCATTAAWPHEPATIDYHATEGRSWRVELSPAGARTGRAPADGTPATAAASGTAGELVLLFYDRIPLDALKLEGDARVFDQIIAWDPSV
ncbi:maleylpyruvate isomerase family mycothiol-dependent enzyme [Paractinoplanes hotanensis]|uniref:Maleylpyruvate isomerase family mycothiol-dependent enzyme n=1 Tax=Paractinoplanes hotanensis TaxID=2906497 RepID=A0ABT0Y258_9ACTN|nr:maleylpyruvate isomerase family mycothiol-dependent enzyme [Actinoplanes hotanensis]MCM4080113.1 maleylpyruvate isomerase family mycothiol-dependent enzyme [Actinoplanes hotanensis]